MKVEKKFKVFTFCLIVFFYFPNPIAFGQIDIKNAIIGKWERYDPDQQFGELFSGKETIEFFKDGTVSGFHEGLGLPTGGHYRFIDNNHIRIELGGFWALIGPLVYKVSISGDKLTLIGPDGKIEEYHRVGTKPVQIESTQDKKRETKPQIAGYTEKFSNLNYFLHSMSADVLKCPRKSCDNYEEEAAKVLVSHLLTKKSGEWLFGYLLEKMTWGTVKKLILSGLDEITTMAIDVGEEIVKEEIQKIKKQFEEVKAPKVFSLGWKDIGVLPIYLPYKERDGRYGKVDGETLMVFYSPHHISIEEIKNQVKSKNPFSLYVPPIGLHKKLSQLPNKVIVRPFKLIIRGTVYELGEVSTYEAWGETIKGPFVTF